MKRTMNLMKNHEDEKNLSQTDISGLKDESVDMQVKQLERQLLKKEILIQYLEKKCANNIFKNTEKLENKIHQLEFEKSQALEEKKKKLSRETVTQLIFFPPNKNFIQSETIYNQETGKNISVQTIILKLTELEDKRSQKQSPLENSQKLNDKILQQKKKSSKNLKKQTKQFETSQQLSLSFTAPKKKHKKIQVTMQNWQTETQDKLFAQNQELKEKIKELQEQLEVKNAQLNSSKIFEPIELRKQKNSYLENLDKKNKCEAAQIEDFQCKIDMFEQELQVLNIKNNQLLMERAQIQRLIQSENEQKIKKNIIRLEQKYSHIK